MVWDRGFCSPEVDQPVWELFEDVPLVLVDAVLEAPVPEPHELELDVLVLELDELELDELEFDCDQWHRASVEHCAPLALPE